MTKPDTLSGYETGVFTEKDILKLRVRLNNCKEKRADRLKEFSERMPDSMGYRFTDDQTTKGLTWLFNQWKTPTGKERKNNPFGYRETSALEQFKEFRLVDLYDAGNNFFSFYIPVYLVIGETTSFEYYVSGGEVNIVG